MKSIKEMNDILQSSLLVCLFSRESPAAEGSQFNFHFPFSERSGKTWGQVFQSSLSALETDSADDYWKYVTTSYSSPFTETTDAIMH